LTNLEREDPTKPSEELKSPLRTPDDGEIRTKENLLKKLLEEFHIARDRIKDTDLTIQQLTSKIRLLS